MQLPNFILTFFFWYFGLLNSLRKEFKKTYIKGAVREINFHKFMIYLDLFFQARKC